MKYAVEIASCSMIYLTSFMNICAGVRALLRFCLRNLKAEMLVLLMGGIFFNYSIEMVLGVVIYVPSFIKIGSGIQKLMGGGYTHRQQSVLISLLFFFKTRKAC
jgi:hypothetical protein